VFGLSPKPSLSFRVFEGRGEEPHRGRYFGCLWQTCETGSLRVRLQGAHCRREPQLLKRVKRVGGRDQEAGFDRSERECLRGETPRGLKALVVWQQVAEVIALQRGEPSGVAGFRACSEAGTAREDEAWRQVLDLCRVKPCRLKLTSVVGAKQSRRVVGVVSGSDRRKRRNAMGGLWRVVAYPVAKSRHDLKR
jgi:hypothetical protein